MSRKWILPCVDAHDVGRAVLVLQARRMFVNEFCHWYSFNWIFHFVQALSEDTAEKTQWLGSIDAGTCHPLQERHWLEMRDRKSVV